MRHCGKIILSLQRNLGLSHVMRVSGRRCHLCNPAGILMFLDLGRTQMHAASKKGWLLFQRLRQQYHRVVVVLLFQCVVPFFPELTYLASD